MAKYDHHEIKIIGDSFMVIFRDALTALDFAWALERDTGDERIRIRAGIHVGGARIIEDDIYGTMVNYTKRVESVQNEGGITLSDFAKREITNAKAQRHSWLSFHSLEVPLKGFQERETVWVIITPGTMAKAIGQFAGQLLAERLTNK